MLQGSARAGHVRIQVLPSPLTAHVNWRQASHAGSTSLHVLMTKHSCTKALLRSVPQFEELSGRRVLCHILDEDEYWPKVKADFASGGGLGDVLMVSPYDFCQNVSLGHFEPLAGYLQNGNLTDCEWYAPEDFYPALLDFAEGRTGMIIDCDWFAASDYERPERSRVAGRVRYAQTPPGPPGPPGEWRSCRPGRSPSTRTPTTRPPPGCSSSGPPAPPRCWTARNEAGTGTRPAGRYGRTPR
jgi:ABC-type glycerol-3-phosphate transport system substrate-binding protein